MTVRFYVIVVLISFLITSCSIHKDSLDSETVHIVFPITNPQVWNLDPSTAHREIDLKALHYLYRGLMKLSPDLIPIQDTALKPKIDNKRLKLSLQKNLYWTDGTPLSVLHYKDGILRSLHQESPTPAAVSFQRLLTEECQTTQDWSNCIYVSNNLLIINLRVSGDHALPYLTQAFTFPQRIDILNVRKEKLYLSPSAYPSIGPYKIIKHRKHELILEPLDPSIEKIHLSQVQPDSIKKKNFTQRNIQIIEPPPLKLLKDMYWQKHLRPFSDFNLLALVEYLPTQERSLIEATSASEIQAYIKEKGLPLHEPPTSLGQMLRICQNNVPKIMFYPEHVKFKEPLQLLGPKNLFAFLAVESIQKQLFRNQIQKLEYIPISLKNLHGYTVQRRPPHALYLFRSRVPSLIHIFEMFFSRQPDSLAAKENTFYDFLFKQFLNVNSLKRQETLQDMLKLLCNDEHLLFPLISIPLYAIIHPRIKYYVRDGSGVYKVWKK